MPCTVPVAVVMLQEPVGRIAIRPTYTPALARADGTCARTMSPVLNPSTTLVALGALSGNPVAFVRHICRLCRPVARMANGTTPRMSSVAGVLAPTQAASSQCILGKLRCVRFHLVCPPVPVSRGNPSALKRWKSAQRVAFTAAASRNGSWPWPGNWSASGPFQAPPFTAGVADAGLSSLYR
jgi:hypothetical protein